MKEKSTFEMATIVAMTYFCASSATKSICLVANTLFGVLATNKTQRQVEAKKNYFKVKK
jgi:hypothetical protein